MRLKTSHGTYVVTGANGELLHLPDPSHLDFPSVWSAAPPPIPEVGSVEATVCEGPLAPSILAVLADGRVAFRRDGLYLCADPRFPELRFDRDDAAGWERFAIETEQGMEVRLPWAGPPIPALNVSRPVLIETLAGYQLVTRAADAQGIAITAADLSTGPITRYTMADGSWIVDLDGTPDPDQPFLVYWFYPFDERIHVWRLDRFGRRVAAHDLSDAEAQSFLSARRSLGAAFTARLYMLSQKADQRGVLALLGADVLAAAEAGSADALYAVLRHPLAFPPAAVRSLADRAFHLIRAANRATVVQAEAHPARFTVDALAKALRRLDPALGGRTQDQLQSELDLGAFLAGPQHRPAIECALDFTLHRHSLQRLTALLGGFLSDQAIGILLRPDNKTVEFHYTNSHLNHRAINSMYYAYYVLSTHQAKVWDRLAQLDPACGAWMVRLEAGDLPLTAEPSAAFERRSGDATFALIPDPYYFDFRGFRRGWFNGDVPCWAEKETRFLWRGSTTGAGDLTAETIGQAPRVRLCDIGRTLGPVADFGITNVVQTRSQADAVEIKRLLQSQHIWREQMPQHVMASAKFLIEIDGNANSWGFFAKLLMGSCILKVDSPFEQWFYDRLRPWVHYVPVCGDLSDLSDKVQWCLANEDACRDIAAEGQRLAQALDFDSAMSTAANTLMTVARPFRAATRLSG